MKLLEPELDMGFFNQNFRKLKQNLSNNDDVREEKTAEFARTSNIFRSFGRHREVYVFGTLHRVMVLALLGGLMHSKNNYGNVSN